MEKKEITMEEFEILSEKNAFKKTKMDLVNEGYAVQFDPDEVDELAIIDDPAVDTDEDVLNQFETAEEIEAYIQMCEEKYYGE